MPVSCQIEEVTSRQQGQRVSRAHTVYPKRSPCSGKHETPESTLIPRRPSNAQLDLPRAGGDHRRVLALLRFPEGNGGPRAPAEGPADAGAAKRLVRGADETG